MEDYIESDGTGEERKQDLARTLITIAVVCLAVLYGWFRFQQGRDDFKAGQCEQNLNSINEMLDFYYHDLKIETKAGRYPARLQDLTPRYVGSAAKLRCPVFNVPYRYELRRRGQGFLMACSAKHRASYLGEPFYLAVTDGEGLVRCFVRKGAVIKWTQVGELQHGWLRERAIVFEEPAPDFSAALFR
jgi:hypothetical protein